MICLDMNYHSSALSGNAQVSILLPSNASPHKTLWLLHGLHGDHTWTYWDEKIKDGLDHILKNEE